MSLFLQPEVFRGDVLPPRPPFEVITEENVDVLGEPVAMFGSDLVQNVGLLKPVGIKVSSCLRYEGSDLVRVPQLGFILSKFMVALSGNLIRDPGFKGVSVTDLRGVEVYLGTSSPTMVFRYWEQERGEEGFRRVVRPTGDVYYGIHKDHRGDPARGIRPERPGWYFRGFHVGNMIEKPGGGEAYVPLEQVAEKCFPFARIVEGPIGNPNDEAFRAELGLY